MRIREGSISECEQQNNTIRHPNNRDRTFNPLGNRVSNEYNAHLRGKTILTKEEVMK